MTSQVDTQWSNAEYPWQRVQWARAYAGFPNMQAAADSLGMRQNTYSAFERDPAETTRPRKLDHEHAIKFGAKFKVSWIWLLLGQGTPFERPLTEHQARVAAALEDHPLEEQARLAAAVEMLVKKAG